MIATMPTRIHSGGRDNACGTLVTFQLPNLLLPQQRNLTLLHVFIVKLSGRG